MTFKPLVAAAGLLVALPASALAQSPDFLFGRPHVAITVRTGRQVARGGSDFYTFVQDQLTVRKKDFNAPAFGVDLGFAMTPRLAAVVGYDFSASMAASEYRNLVDNDRLPINQTTTLRQHTISGTLTLALTPRGREVSRHAWIPSAATPYVGAGVGLVHYSLLQDGDFVDFTDNSVFPHTFESSHWGPSAHVLVGVDLKATRRVAVNVEARYVLAHARLGQDFSGFNPIDLAGFKMTGGIRYTF